MNVDAETDVAPSRLARKRPQGRLFARFEEVLTVVVMLMMTNAFLPMLSGGAYGSDEAFQAVFIGLYLLLLVPQIRLVRRIIGVAALDASVVALLIFAAASVVWSASPELSAWRIVALALTTAFGFYLATRFSLREQLRLLAISLAIACFASVLFVVAMPDLATGRIGGSLSWNGIYHQKNVLGRVMSLATLVFATHAMLTRGRCRFASWAMFAFAAFLVVMSRSTTAIFALGVVVFSLPVVFTRRLRRSLRLAIVIFWAVLAVGVGTLVFEGRDTLLDLADKDESLSGRTRLWPEIWEEIERQPWLGYGYSAYWQGLAGPSRDLVSLYPRWSNEPSHAHSGVFDLALDLGLVGAAIFMLGWLRAVVRACNLVLHDRRPELFFLAMFLAWTTIFMVVQSIALNRNSLIWALYVSTLSSVELVRLRARRQAAPQPGSAGGHAAPVPEASSA